MPSRQQRLKRFSSPDNREGLPLHELLQLSESGRLAIKACYEIQAARDNKRLVWDDRRDWEQIDDIRLRYFNGRAAEVTSIRTDDEFDETAILVQDACAKLIEATERNDFGTELLWTMVAAGHADLERGRIRALVDTLCIRTKAFDQLVMKADFRRIKIGDARSRLIVRLADHFCEKGLRPTAAVNYGEGANPSPLVALVILMMASLPEPLQESAQGLPAFSKTVSRMLRSRTQGDQLGRL
jgi:hypothetical protein